MPHLRSIVILLFFSIISSCGIFSNKNLAKRYTNRSNNIFANSTEPQLFVKVDFTTATIKDATTTNINYNLLSLTDKGQEAYIVAANAKSSDAKELMEILNSNFNFKKDQTPNFRIIPKTVKKSLIFTIERPKYIKKNDGAIVFNLMGDRIGYLELSLRIPIADKAKFDSWDRYVTDHYTLNLGKVTSAQQWNASLNLNAKGSGEISMSGGNTSEDFESNKNTTTMTLVNTGANGSGTNGNNLEVLTTGKNSNISSKNLKSNAELGGSGTIGFTDKFETTLDLNSRILKLSGSLAEKSILLRQESGPSLDLSGNVAVSVEYALTDDWASPVRFHKIKDLYVAGSPIIPASLKISNFIVLFPDIQSNITGEVNYSFLYRQVNRGNRHIPEARQAVKFWYGNVPYTENDVLNKAKVDLIKKEDIRPKGFIIKNGVHSINLNGIDLQFETISEAAGFLDYLGIALKAGIAMTGMSINGNTIVSADYVNLKIHTIQF